MADTQKIIIKTPRFIGDTIMMLSAFELLRAHYGDAKFTVVTPPACVDIFRGMGVDIIVDDTKGGNKGRLSKMLRLLGALRRERYDLGFLFHNTFVDALLFRLAKINTVIGYDKESRKFLLDFSLKIDRNRHYINHYAFLVNSYLQNCYQKLPPIRLLAEKSTLIAESSRPRVGFVLGGENKKSRTYPPQLSLRLFELLKTAPIDIILLGDKEDSPNNAKYEEFLSTEYINAQNLSGKTSVGEFIDTIAALDLLVTIDTSAMHIAAATDTPFIALIGKGTSVFETVRPKVDFGHYLRRDALDIDESRSIENITPEEIADKINKVLHVG